jgi:DNA-binding response OmpR family regulator
MLAVGEMDHPQQEDREPMARVLVIDDEQDILVLCRLNLQRAGHEVFEALDGERGIELARRHRPDVVVLDLMLPTIDGYEVLDTLVRERRDFDPAVVVLTAKAREEDRLRSLSGGADEFVTKPFSPDHLVEVLERLAADRIATRRGGIA